MNLTTTFAPGDLAWVFHRDRVQQLTVGMVRVEVVDSAGSTRVEGDIVSHGGDGSSNYGAMVSRTEQYMMTQTGIGSGSVYTLGQHIFASEAECRAASAEQIARIKQEKADREEWQRRQRVDRIASLRAELASLEGAPA